MVSRKSYGDRQALWFWTVSYGSVQAVMVTEVVMVWAVMVLAAVMEEDRSKLFTIVMVLALVMVPAVVMVVGLSFYNSINYLQLDYLIWCVFESAPLPFRWEVYVEPYVEGDVYTVVGSISVDHDMDGGAVTPDIILNQDNMFYFSDSSLLGGASSSINATFKFFAETPESEVFGRLLWTTSKGYSS